MLIFIKTLCLVKFLLLYFLLLDLSVLLYLLVNVYIICIESEKCAQFVFAYNLTL